MLDSPVSEISRFKKSPGITTLILSGNDGLDDLPSLHILVSLESLEFVNIEEFEPSLLNALPKGCHFHYSYYEENPEINEIAKNKLIELHEYTPKELGVIGEDDIKVPNKKSALFDELSALSSSFKEDHASSDGITMPKRNRSLSPVSSGRESPTPTEATASETIEVTVDQSGNLTLASGYSEAINKDEKIQYESVFDVDSDSQRKIHH